MASFEAIAKGATTSTRFRFSISGTIVRSVTGTTKAGGARCTRSSKAGLKAAGVDERVGIAEDRRGVARVEGDCLVVTRAHVHRQTGTAQGTDDGQGRSLVPIQHQNRR